MVARQCEGEQHEQHQQQPAHVTQGKGEPRDQPHTVHRRYGRQHGVVEHLGNGEADFDDEQHRNGCSQAKACAPGFYEPQAERTQGHHQHGTEDPGFAAPVLVGNSAKEGGCQRQHEAGAGGDVADQGLPAYRIADHGIAEIRVEDIDDHHDVIGIASRLAEGPAEVAQGRCGGGAGEGYGVCQGTVAPGQ